MAYSPINKSSSFMNTKLYTGTGASNAITSVGFQPDFTWIKNRDATDFHVLTDAVRGVTKYIKSNATDAEATDAESLKTFDSDGFTVGTSYEVNTNTERFCSWNWKANGAGSLNEVGSLDSTVSVNTTSGFSIVKYTGDTSAATVGHGLGVVPKMIILKNISSVNSWFVYHHDLGATKYMVLDTTAAVATATSIWNDTTPTSTVFSVGTTNAVSGDDYIAYCFADVAGYSKFSSYTGNGSTDGPFIYTGFKPTWLLVKRAIGGTQDWQEFNNKINPYNVATLCLRPNQINGDQTGNAMDLLSNGFKNRLTGSSVNTSGDTYIYMAFGQPIISNSGVCATAR